MQKLFSYLLLGTALSLGTALASGSAIAQTSDLDPLEGLGTDDDGADLFGDTSNPYELIHRAILAPSMSADEFQERQDRAISGEAEDFRLRQQEALRQIQNAETAPTDEISVDGEAL
ncbi:hypothetical protein [Oscillatoria sp. CS-180]|uniref:hypothetical protein n=1 Tax=Oscillatoria sp. CS-180 TaxID=3021720 RepID=UPI00232E9DDE|nr:hypothetical protein [Oscillatoria sp. CS-180]